MTQKTQAAPRLGRFGHHPDPAIDFCVEVETIEGELADQRAGLAPTMNVAERIARALEFRVGGDPRAVMAKNALRAASAQPLVGEREALAQEAKRLLAKLRDEDGCAASSDETGTSREALEWKKAAAQTEGALHVVIDALASKQPAAASEREWWKAIRVACSRGHAWIARGVRWQDQLTLTEWEVVEPTGTAIYSPSGLGGTLCFWCKPINGAVPEGWSKDARPDGCVSFCGDSIAAAVLVAAAPSVGET